MKLFFPPQFSSIVQRFLLLAGMLLSAAATHAAGRELYQLQVYHLRDQQQQQQVEAFLRDAYLPALHRLGVPKVGVFEPVGNDTTADRRLLVLVPCQSLQQWQRLTTQLEKPTVYGAAGQQYWQAAHNQAPYTRLETILLESFADPLKLQTPPLTGSRPERIYELRSYESATQAQHLNKVQMFVQGDEVGIFKRLGFNAVFYGRVLAGGHMPNLMYMTTFDNKAARDAHWKQFGESADWKKLSALPEYQNNVSHIDIQFLHPVAYSDF
ncbi:NIPSNAP family protein [Hymenobacter aerilatus]|uniref:NIPSNAP family protein n=1 Tax=Hymenobacter aerilatus TaxID=2932251 RepID=A0A8T9T065_9BACT|nr:NIPSNAP family protein [Hymenobacter aerilatus]UOR07257.1 NIPSNAP family protein [Hymenobacter aerilatus]